MAADEPPYLTIGTDVSAKYKGAFCEAKIKKVNRVVKCKVTFKNNLGSFVLTDDQIKGPLRLSADIEAKHPEKNQFCDAVINKLQDYSQYTVVFDDGDETTLRRTSLCLKSGRHFAESPTLDQFPLTNPEHFGTPVIGSGKFKRKRRSTVNSSLDYESSDDDSLPRKLKAIRGKDPDLGKVVCVDYGDRRKKDSWYPGLIVPLPPQSNIKILKEEHLIRSFKDGKYYQVPKKDIREFTKDSGQKVENNALRIAVEKATLYLEKEELPPHWDKVLFIGIDDEESNDSESDTSDDEQSEEKDRFVAQLYKFMDERGTPINKAPSVGNKDLNLYKLFKTMHKLGGYNKVTNKSKWKTVYIKLGLPHSNANGPNLVKQAYKRYLQSFEDFYRKLGCTMVNNSRSTRGRHRSDRNIIVTRTRDRDTASPKSKTGKETKDKIINEKKSEEKKESKSDDSSKAEEKTKSCEKKEDEKSKREERRRVVRKEGLPEKARTREDARKEKNESPEKKGTRSTSKVECEKKDETPKEKKAKPLKEEKPKKEEIPLKERKSTREKKVEEKVSKEKRENPVREKRDLSREKTDPAKETPKGKKEETKNGAEEKSPKRKLERAVKEKKEVIKIKSDEAETKDIDKKEEVPIVEVKEEQTIKKPKTKPEDSVSSEEEEAVSLKDSSASEDKKPKLKTESEDEPPNKGRKKLRADEKDEKESLLGYSDSDESLTNDSGSKELKKEIEVGDRVKVKYGRGRMQKVYEAKVLKIEMDGLEKRYYVHYAGWNMRYDEWVRKNYIVSIINGNKKCEATSKVPPSSMKKQERTRLLKKAVRKNSTSSNNSNVSRSTRSEKKEESTKKISAENCQDSESEDDEEGNDADIEDSSAFKEELFSDDEEKEKLEDAKRGNITELEKTLEPSEDNFSFFASTENKSFLEEGNAAEDIKTENQNANETAENEKFAPLEFSATDVKEDKCDSIQEQQGVPPVSSSDTELKTTPPLEASLPPVPSPEINAISRSKAPVSSALTFSGLIQKPDNAEGQIASESTFLPVFPSINVCRLPEIPKCLTAELDYQSAQKSKDSVLEEECATSENIFTATTKCESPSIHLETNDSREQNESEKLTETSTSCPGLFSSKSSEAVDSLAGVKDPCSSLQATPNVFLPSFSLQGAETAFSKLSSENHIHSEPVDVSKMIPGILERLKNDVVSEFDSPSPPKEELHFDFLRESSSKCLSRSDSSSSLRICESDTNDSNGDSKNLGCNKPFLSAVDSHSCNEFSTKYTLSSIAEVEPTVLSKDSNTESSEKNNEQESTELSIELKSTIESNKFENMEKVVPPDEVELPSPAEEIPTETTLSDSHPKSEEEVDSKNDQELVETQDTSLKANITAIESGMEDCSVKKEAFDAITSLTNSDNSQKEKSDSAASVSGVVQDCSTPLKIESFEQSSSSQLDKTIFDTVSSLKNITFALKKEGKKKKFGKKTGKKFGSSELFEKEDKESKLVKSKEKKKMRFENFGSDQGRSMEMKTKPKKLKKNKNKKRFKREDAFGVSSSNKAEDVEKVFDKVKRKEKKKNEKKFLKCGIKVEDGSDVRMDLLKKKKNKKNRDKTLVEKKEFCEKKTKKKRKLLMEANQDSDSEKETFSKVEKKRKKKKPKMKDCSSSDEGIDKFFKEETMDLPSTSCIKQDAKNNDPDMSFLLCEENVPASPVDMSNLVDDTSSSSSMEEGSSELPNVNNPSTVMDNTPPTTPSSTESLLSSSPSHERDSFPYPESTQSGRESGDDLFRCGSNRMISRGSEEYHAATTLAFAVCQSISESAPSDFAKQKAEVADRELVKRKKKNKRFRRMCESAKSPKHKSFLRFSKVDNCYEDSSGTSLAALSHSPPYGSLNFSRSLPPRLPNTSEDMFYVPLHEKDPEKRIALLQKKMTDLRKQYMALRAEVIAIDHKRRKARKKVSAGSITNASIHSDDGQSCS